jgi:hypothetical protein
VFAEVDVTSMRTRRAAIAMRAIVFFEQKETKF